MREIWGRYQPFTYNEHLIDFYPEQGKYCHAAGTADSECALCCTLNRLRNRFAAKPNAETLFGVVAALTYKIRRYGLLNFVMPNGDCLFAHANTLLHCIVRKAPLDKARLLDGDMVVDFAEVTTPNDKVVIITILSLTRDETWLQLAVDGLVMFRDGNIVHSDRPKDSVYTNAGEGLKIVCVVGVVI